MRTIKIDYSEFISNNFTGIVEYPDGARLWYKEGNLHREDGPAWEFPDGEKQWYKEGKRHRLDGPAIEYPDGEKQWYKEGKRHRLDGPAIEYPDGEKQWYKEGKRHRLDGPAIEYSKGLKEWWIEGKFYLPKKLSELFKFSFCFGKEKGKYNLEWLKFLTEEGIEEFPIIPGMKGHKEFIKIFESLENKQKNKNYIINYIYYIFDNIIDITVFWCYYNYCILV
jgi:hypothetical protein